MSRAESNLLLQVSLPSLPVHYRVLIQVKDKKRKIYLSVLRELMVKERQQRVWYLVTMAANSATNKGAMNYFKEYDRTNKIAATVSFLRVNIFPLKLR
jgi:hypothetical protein